MTARTKDDLAAILAENAKALSQDKKLLVHLDEIIAEEKVRNAASDKIRAIWKQVRSEGFDIEDARRKLVRRACGG